MVMTLFIDIAYCEKRHKEIYSIELIIVRNHFRFAMNQITHKPQRLRSWIPIIL